MLEVHIIELPKVKRLIKTDNIFKEDEDFKIWTKFLLMPNELEEKKMEENEAVKNAKEELEKIQNDEYEQRIAELRMKHIRDTKSVEAYGYDKGFEKGKEAGKSEGKKEGKIEGKIEGTTETKKEIAKKLLSKNFKIEEIIEITGLTKEEIDKL